MSEKEKGDFYENFCTHFLRDIGVDCNTTSSSGDGGIDIIGKVTFDTGNKLFNHILSTEAILLAQSKCYENKVDTPVIRKIIGDSLFYKFGQFDGPKNPLYLIVFSHKGFTDKAKQFAKENMVVTIDSETIIDIACNHSNIEQMACIDYLHKSINKKE